MTDDFSKDEAFNLLVDSNKFPTVPTIEEFNRRFFLLTHGILEGIDWTNILCAGGSVLGN